MHFTKVEDKKRLSGALFNFKQNGCKSCFCFFVFLLLLKIVEGINPIFGASDIKPSFSSIPNCITDFQNSSFKIADVFPFSQLKPEIICISGFDVASKLFNVTPESFSSHSSFATVAENVGKQNTNKTDKERNENWKWYKHLRWLLMWAIIGLILGSCLYDFEKWARSRRKKPGKNRCFSGYKNSRNL